MTDTHYTPELLRDGPDDADYVFVFAHGAGQGMDAPFMDDIAEGVAQAGFHALRFEFPYMATARAQGKRKPPDRMPKLLSAWSDVVLLVENEGWRREQIVIGGKSMGGRMASLIADEQAVAGLICLGYPFHPPGKPDNPRVAHLEGLNTPALICQGARDTFGTQEDVKGYSLSHQIELCWLNDGDHGFKPRKKSGLTLEDNIATAVAAMVGFMQRRLPPP